METGRRFSAIDNIFMKSLLAVGIVGGAGLIADGALNIANPAQPDECVSYVNNGEVLTADELNRRLQANECRLTLSQLNDKTFSKEVSLGSGLIIGSLPLGAAIALSRRSRKEQK